MKDFKYLLNYLIFQSWTLCFCSNTYPKNIYIGAMAPLFKADNTVDQDGISYIASLIMAINEINNKSDGFYDNLLPNMKIKLAFRSPRRNFIMATNMALQLSSAFDGNGVVGVVGPLADDACKATAQIFAYTEYKVPQISYGASSADLADKTLYPYFMRTASSVAYEGVVIAHLIRSKFEWSTVNTICVADTYGNDVCEEFKTEAKILGLNIESSNTFWAGTKDFRDILLKIKSGGGILKIFVLFMKAADAAVILEQGTEVGLFKEGVQIIGTQYILTSNTLLSISSTSQVTKIMKGIISVSPTTIPNKNLYLDFVRRWRAQNNTLGHGKWGKDYTCDTTKDDDGSTYLYQGFANAKDNSSYTCAGLNFSTFAVDGSDINTIALNVYDSVVLLAKGLHKLYYQDGLTSFTGENLMNVLQNITFIGLTGYIGFDHTSRDKTSYGQGDRNKGLTYNVFNFNPSYYNSNTPNASVATAVRKIGIWQSDSLSFTSCDLDTDTSCSDIVYNTVDNSIPIDKAPIVEIQMPNLTRVLLRVAVSIVLTSTLLFLFLVITFRNHKIVKASQPAMLMIVLVGALLACFRVIVATIDIIDATCVAGKWLGHLSFGLFFGAVILKTWRVNMVVNSGMKRVRITVVALQQMLGVGLLLLVCYLLVDTLIGQPRRSYEESYDGHNTIRKIKCTSNSPHITTVLFILEGMLLVYGAKLCWSTKNVPDAVNDSQFIAMALFLIVFVCALTFPIVFLKLQPTPAMLLTIMASGFVIGTFGSTMVLFAPKAYLLLTGADVNENFEIVRVSHSKIESSSAPERESGTPITRMFLNISSVIASRVQSEHLYAPTKSPGSVALIVFDNNDVEQLQHSTSQHILMKRGSSVPKLRHSQLSIDYPLKERKGEGEVKSSDKITSHCLLDG